jgi:hypothetical protein
MNTNNKKNTIKGKEKIAGYKWTIHGEYPYCKCGNFLTLIGDKELEWICINCEPEKLRRNKSE